MPLDKSGEVIRPAKLWCDTTTAAECEEIMAAHGGLKATIKKQGNGVGVPALRRRFFGSKA